MPDGFDRKFWEARYRERSPDHPSEPNLQLVTEAERLEPGSALDAGCGEGGDAIWLAVRGWRVTAVDFSPTALRRARESAMTLGTDIADRVDWVEADLATWDPGERRFDLVCSQYVHPSGTLEALVERLASAVAPGGTLLLVGHDPAGADHADSERHHDDRGPVEESFVSTDEVTALLAPDDWEILVAETRDRTGSGSPGEPAMFHDSVVRARRRVPTHLTGVVDPARRG
jgi:SAM-dependent methyltransferase